MLNKSLKIAGLIGVLVAAPAAFADGMGGMGRGGFGMGGFGMGSFGGAAVLTSNGVMYVNSLRSFGSDDFRSVSAAVMPTTVAVRGFDGDDARFVTVPATTAVTTIPSSTAVPVTTVFRNEGFNEGFESRGFGRDFR